VCLLRRALALPVLVASLICMHSIVVRLRWNGWRLGLGGVNRNLIEPFLLAPTGSYNELRSQITNKRQVKRTFELEMSTK